MPARVSDEKFAKDLARRVVALRKIQNMTQSQLAAILGVTQQAIQKYERAERRIPVSLLPPLAEALDASVEELLGIAPKGKKRGQASQLERRFEKVSELPTKAQKEILKVVDALLAQAS